MSAEGRLWGGARVEGAETPGIENVDLMRVDKTIARNIIHTPVATSGGISRSEGTAAMTTTAQSAICETSSGNRTALHMLKRQSLNDL